MHPLNRLLNGPYRQTIAMLQRNEHLMAVLDTVPVVPRRGVPEIKDLTHRLVLSPAYDPIVPAPDDDRDRIARINQINRNWAQYRTDSKRALMDVAHANQHLLIYTPGAELPRWLASKYGVAPRVPELAPEVVVPDNGRAEWFHNREVYARRAAMIAADNKAIEERKARIAAHAARRESRG